jgi:predicted transcriptional regulator
LGEGEVTTAFRHAFGALESCYRTTASQHGWNPDRGFKAATKWLVDGNVISPGDFHLADHLWKARNVVLHGLGFEPSAGQVQRTIGDVRRLCSRFSRTVADVMTSPVLTVTADQPIGQLFRHIIDGGISQFPVIEDSEVVGLITDAGVLQALDEGDGLLDPTTQVRDLMEETNVLPRIESSATLEEAWRQLRNLKAPALLVPSEGLPKGIVTKYDLLRRAEL